MLRMIRKMVQNNYIGTDGSRIIIIRVDTKIDVN